MGNVLHSVDSSAADCGRRPPATEQAFTIVEIMVATGVFSLLMGSILAMFVWYARASSGVSRQLQMNNGTRALNFMANEIKSATSVAVQNYNGVSFSNIATGSVQQGNALSVTVSNSSTTLQVYYWLNSTGQLYRATSVTSRKDLWLDNITNTVPFTLRTFSGAVASDPAQRAAVEISFYALDTNVRNFRQAVVIRDTVMKRN